MLNASLTLYTLLSCVLVETILGKQKIGATPTGVPVAIKVEHGPPDSEDTHNAQKKEEAIAVVKEVGPIITRHFGATHSPRELASFALDYVKHKGCKGSNLLYTMVSRIFHASLSTVMRARQDLEKFNKSVSDMEQYVLELKFSPHLYGIVAEDVILAPVLQAHQLNQAQQHQFAQPVVPQNQPLQAPQAAQVPVNLPQNVNLVYAYPQRGRGRPRRVDFMALGQNLNVMPPAHQHLWNYFNINAPARSGSPGIRHLPQATWAAAYLAYLQWFRGQQFPAVEQLNFLVFQRITRLWQIRRFRHDRYACPMCEMDRQNPMQGANPAQNNHQLLVHQMNRIYQVHVALLRDPCYALVLLDYARFHEVKSASCETHELKKDGGHKKGNVKMSALTMAILSGWNSEEGKPNIHHITVLGPVPQGPAFMKYSVDLLHNHLKEHLPQLETLNIWADGGLRSFGSLECFSDLCKPESQLKVVAHYYAPYHGHNVCDGHFGTAKLKLRRLGWNGMIPHEKLEEVFKSISNTSVHTILSTTPPLAVSKPTKKISLRNYQCFEIQRTGEGITVKCHAQEVPSEPGHSDMTYTIGPQDTTVTTTTRVINKASIVPDGEEPIDDEDEGWGQRYDTDSEDEFDDDDDLTDEQLFEEIDLIKSNQAAIRLLGPRAMARAGKTTDFPDILKTAYQMKSKNKMFDYLIVQHNVVTEVNTLCSDKFEQGKNWTEDSWVQHGLSVLNQPLEGPSS